MYNLEEEIIHFIFTAFNNKKRKKENIDLVFHSIMVGNMLKNLGYSDEIVFIGYLHDIIEDTSYNYEYLKRKYGKEIADGVNMLTQDNTIQDWKQCKTAFIKKIKTLNKDLLMVELADKLHNLLSDYFLFQEKGRSSLVTEGETFSNIKWYYINLQTIFNEKLENNNLLKRYNEIVNIYFFSE